MAQAVDCFSGAGVGGHRSVSSLARMLVVIMTLTKASWAGTSYRSKKIKKHNNLVAVYMYTRHHAGSSTSTSVFSHFRCVCEVYTTTTE